jgi:hypothetical protein
MTQEALKLALKALNAGEHAHLIMNTDGIKDKVRQAIADLESQERNFCPRCGKRTNDIHTCTPPQSTWVGLDEAEIIDLTCECIDKGEFNMDCAIDFAKAIEAKLKELNT